MFCYLPSAKRRAKYKISYFASIITYCLCNLSLCCNLGINVDLLCQLTTFFLQERLLLIIKQHYIVITTICIKNYFTITYNFYN